jgi:GNAT superfamily N-acetyltransferase
LKFVPLINKLILKLIPLHLVKASIWAQYSKVKYKMQIKEIQSREEIFETYQVMSQIYDTLNEETYVDDILNMVQRGYKMTAVFEDEDVNNGKCIGVVGIRIIRKLNYGKTIEIEDFMIDREKRNIGVGKMLLRWVEWQAAIFGCKNIIGTLETRRLPSQKIFAREKFNIDGFFFKKSS